jgi:hypothetical protein
MKNPKVGFFKQAYQGSGRVGVFIQAHQSLRVRLVYERVRTTEVTDEHRAGQKSIGIIMSDPIDS